MLDAPRIVLIFLVIIMDFFCIGNWLYNYTLWVAKQIQQTVNNKTFSIGFQGSVFFFMCTQATTNLVKIHCSKLIKNRKIWQFFPFDSWREFIYTLLKKEVSVSYSFVEYFPCLIDLIIEKLLLPVPLLD